VGLGHVLADEDVIQIYKSKTKSQLAKAQKINKGTKANQKKEDAKPKK
jgi:uncharacterized protein